MWEGRGGPGNEVRPLPAAVSQILRQEAAGGGCESGPPLPPLRGAPSGPCPASGVRTAAPHLEARYNLPLRRH